MTHNMTALF